jgi:hypothetical protein
MSQFLLDIAVAFILIVGNSGISTGPVARTIPCFRALCSSPEALECLRRYSWPGNVREACATSFPSSRP